MLLAMEQQPRPQDPEPRWPALIAMLAASGFYAALPASLTPVPAWVLLATVTALAVPLVATHRLKAHRTNVLLGHIVSAVLTLFLLVSVVMLVLALPEHKETPVDLLRSAVSIWATNVVVFGLWYWRLDAGGPHQRDSKEGHEVGAFLFPQMMVDGPASCEADGTPWSPRFVDYLFLAFNTSTAFSPTDAPIMSRWAKLMVMTQAMISLTVVVILAGRAVNIL